MCICFIFDNIFTFKQQEYFIRICLFVLYLIIYLYLNSILQSKDGMSIRRRLLLGLHKYAYNCFKNTKTPELQNSIIFSNILKKSIYWKLYTENSMHIWKCIEENVKKLKYYFDSLIYWYYFFLLQNFLITFPVAVAF